MFKYFNFNTELKLNAFYIYKLYQKCYRHTSAARESHDSGYIVACNSPTIYNDTDKKFITMDQCYL